MIQQPLRLYVDAQFASPYAMSAFVALHEKRLSSEITAVNLEASENLAVDFAGLSMTSRVPAAEKTEVEGYSSWSVKARGAAR